MIILKGRRSVFAAQIILHSLDSDSWSRSWHFVKSYGVVLPLRRRTSGVRPTDGRFDRRESRSIRVMLSFFVFGTCINRYGSATLEHTWIQMGGLVLQIGASRDGVSIPGLPGLLSAVSRACRMRWVGCVGVDCFDYGHIYGERDPRRFWGKRWPFPAHSFTMRYLPLAGTTIALVGWTESLTISEGAFMYYFLLVGC